MNFKEIYNNIFSNIRKKQTSEIRTTSHDWNEDLCLENRIDTKKARGIYQNIERDYKLGSSVLICAVNSLVDYLGVPQIQKPENAVIKELQKSLNSIVNTIHRKSFVEGNFFVWSNWNKEKKELEHIIYNYENMDNIVFDVDTHELLEVSFKHIINYNDENGNHRSMTRERTFTKTSIITKYTGEIQKGLKEKEIYNHYLGKLPIIFHRFNKSKDEVYGHGIVEPAAPYLRALSKTLENRVIEDTRIARSKLHITDQNPERFLNNTAIINGLSDSSGMGGVSSLDLENMEIIFSVIDNEGNSGDAKWLQPVQSAADSLKVFATLFQCCIEIFGTPEWVFPAKLGASYASVEAQVPSWIQHIENLRTREFQSQWEEQVRLDCDVYCAATMKRKPEINIKWKRLDLETPELRAKIVNYMISSMKLARENCLMTDAEIRDYLDEYLNNLGDYGSLYSELPKMIKNLKDFYDAKKGTDEPQDQSDRSRPTEGENSVTNENRDKKTE